MVWQPCCFFFLCRIIGLAQSLSLWCVPLMVISWLELMWIVKSCGSLLLLVMLTLPGYMVCVDVCVFVCYVCVYVCCVVCSECLSVCSECLSVCLHAYLFVYL